MQDTKPSVGPESVVPALSVKALAEVLVKHHGLHSGLYETLVEFQIGIGAFGPDPDRRLPGAMIAISRIGLTAVQERGPNAVDAAEVNPEPKPARSRTRAK